MQRSKISFILLTFILAFGLPLRADDAKSTTAVPVKTENTVNDFIAGKGNVKGNDISVETEYYNIDFESQGGNVKAFRHKDKEYETKNNVDIVVDDPFFFNVYKTPDSATLFKESFFKLNKTEDKNYITVTASLNVIARTDKGDVPVKVIKKYQFEKKSHYWEFNWEIENMSNRPLDIPTMFFIPMNDIGPTTKKSHVGNDEKYLKNFYYIDGKFKSVATHAGKAGGFFSCGKEEEPGKVETTTGNIEYFGMGSRFMVMTVQPLHPASAVTVIVNNHERKEMHAHLSGFSVAPKATGGFDFLIYTGPKIKKFTEVSPQEMQKRPILKKMHPEMYKAFDFGITAPIRDFLVLILKGLYKIIPNYGVGIILLVIMLKLVFFPLNQAQARSMKKMQILQPKIKEINEKYKNNPQEKQRKTIQLYKEHKANPMGGCLPMVIQIPIIIALISAFSDSYELWGSPFIKGWINDLSQPDTIYTFANNLPVIGGAHLNILPIIMVVSQFLQSTFTTVSVEKSQKMMMQILPVVMVVMFWNFPSGVVLYWILFNLLSVLQQFITNKFEKTEA